MRRFPPIAQLATLSLVLIIAGGIVMVSAMPNEPSLAVPAALLALSALILAVNVVLLLTLRDFAWRTFSTVGRWALLAYTVSGGMIEFTFLHNHVSGTPLLLLTLMLLMFVINVPLIISFTVARYETRG
ncbi:MAG: hypothetical protein ACXWMG_02085 [Candidatus Limnocylindria bacterium]